MNMTVMAKKKSPIGEYAEKIIAPIVSNLAEVVGKSIKSVSVDAIRRKVRVYVGFLVILTAATTVALFGIGSLLGYYFYEMPPGTSHIIVGAIAIIAAVLYEKYSA